MSIDVFVEVFHDFLALPTKVKDLTDASMDGAVAHNKDHVASREFQHGVEDLFAADFKRGAVGEVLGMAIVVPDGFRVVEFEQVTFSLFVDVNYGEGAVGQLTFLADREGLDDGFHTFFDVGIVGYHGAKDFACESCQDVCFNATAQAIGQNDGGIVTAFAEFYVVAT